MTYVSLVTWRTVVEEAERRRIRSIFSKVVSPKIVQELVQAETFPSLEGARREITVLFADVRGFTELTDRSQEKAEEFVRDRRLSVVVPVLRVLVVGSRGVLRARGARGVGRGRG